jgi:hypothetical protein
MRVLLIFGLLALTGCAGSPHPIMMEWNALLPHPDASPSPTLENGQLTLSGDAVRSRSTYSAPLTIECELQSEATSAKGAFYINLVPQNVPATELAQDYFGIKLSDDKTTLEIWESQGNQPAHLLKSTAIPVQSPVHYKLVVEVQRGNFSVDANGVTLSVKQGVPFDTFQVELRTFPPPSLWHVINFVIR